MECGGRVINLYSFLLGERRVLRLSWKRNMFTSISFLGCPYSAWLRRVKRNSMSRYFLSSEGRREERESRVTRSKGHVTCLVVARPRGDDGGEIFLFSQGRRRGVLSLLT